MTWRNVEGEVDGGQAGARVAIDGDKSILAVEHNGRTDAGGKEFRAERGNRGLRNCEGGREIKRELLRNVRLIRSQHINGKLLRTERRKVAAARLQKKIVGIKRDLVCAHTVADNCDQ